MYAKIVCFALIFFLLKDGALGQTTGPQLNLPINGVLGQTAANVLQPPIPLPISAVLGPVGNLPIGFLNNTQVVINGVGPLGTFLQNSGILDQLNTLTNTLGLNDLGDIERPCHVSFTKCIRQYFAQHGHCKTVEGPIPDNLHRPLSTIYFPRINLTLTALDAHYSGLNGTIEEFYINKATDKMVISIQFRNVSLYSKDTYYRFHRRAREPVINVDYMYTTFQTVTTTTIIPQINDLQLAHSETHVSVDEPSSVISFGPKAFVSSDPTIASRLPDFLIAPFINIQEYWLTEGAFIAATFIQKSICDFGIDVL